MVDESTNFLTYLERYLTDDDRGVSIKPKIVQHFTTKSHERTYSLKLKFCCDNCGNKWTTVKGVLDVEYFLDKQSRKLRFNAKVYRQDCMKCGETCMPDEYLDELERVAEAFSNKMFDILFGIKK